MAIYNNSRNGARNGNGARSSLPTVFQKRKTIKYGTSDQIWTSSTSISSTAPSDEIPNSVDISNIGSVPLTILAGYKTYSSETAAADSGETRYLHILLMPGQTWSPNVRGVISTASASTQFDGTTIDNVAPNSNMYADISTVSSGFDNTTDPVTIASADGDFWRVGDYIRCNAEIVEVTAISGNNLTVKRAMLGTDAASHGDGETLRLQFSNSHHDLSKYSVAQTDDDGRFMATNFFGYGRAASGVQGIVPGSVTFKFYESGYQELGLSGITPSTNTGLTVSTAYEFDITVDGGTTFDNLSFTTDSSNVNFGGVRGVLSKIQSALDTQYYTSGNLFEKKVNVGIVGGDVRFTSGSHLSTSAISLGAGSSGTAEFFGTGRIPAAGSIDAAVAAKLPDDVVRDRITNTTSTANVFAYDNGNGGIQGVCSGSINYDTGYISINGAPVNAEFVISASYNSVFSGKLNSDVTDRKNALVEVLANNISQKWDGQAEVSVR